METPGYAVLLYCIYALPRQEGIEQLPWANKVMAGMFVRCHPTAGFENSHNYRRQSTIYTAPLSMHI